MEPVGREARRGLLTRSGPRESRAERPRGRLGRRLRYGVAMVAQDVIEAAGRTLAAVAADPVKIVLFGSRARDDAGPDSDFDILVVERDPADRHAEMVRLDRALRPLGVPFDIVVVSERYAEDWGGVEGSMVHAALTEGRVLHAAA
jgi:predicted nucleotidyltransferase